MYQIYSEPVDSPNSLVLQDPKFPPGKILATPGALAALEMANTSPISLVARHLAGDWGSVPIADGRLNEEALQSGGRLLSSYLIAPDTRIWIITEADRSATTLLLPSEY